MYIKKLLLENIGPISKLEYEFPFNEMGDPKPVVIVGQNGSGKSILLSYIVNSLINAKQTFIENSEVREGKVYKYRSPQYIKVGEQYYFAKLEFESNIESIEWQLRVPKSAFEQNINPLPHQEEFGRIRENDFSVFWANFDEKKTVLEELINNNCTLYFPPNRFEEPAWLNYENLIAKASYSEIKHIQGFSNRNIIQYSPLSQNKDWLLDILFDRQTFEIRTQLMQLQPNVNVPVFAGYIGSSSTLYAAVIEVLQLILRSEQPIRFGVGKRANRQISIMQGDRQLIPNIFQLSTGESLVLNLFLSILRDYDLTVRDFQGLDSIRGIVLIDEIDLHLHSDIQFNVLPALLKRFPKVQFLITTHAPLFLLGMQKEFQDNGFSILSLPDGNEIGSERFEEFQKAYKAFKQSSTFQSDLKKTLEDLQKPIIFVEGEYDIRYVRRAAQLLGKEQILESIEMKDGSGFGNLDKIWRSFDSPIANALPQKVLLLYDCDTQKSNTEKGKVVKRTVSTNTENPILKGIENLFSGTTIERIRDQNSRFIDVTCSTTKIVRGEQVVVPEKLEVNTDEKRSLCDWICENGTREDFEGFETVFQIIESFLLPGVQA